jgi:hypothetical protein
MFIYIASEPRLAKEHAELKAAWDQELEEIAAERKKQNGK